MAFSRWFRRSRRPAPRYRPAVCVLEDRTVPSGFGQGLHLPPLSLPPVAVTHFLTSGPATHLALIAPHNVQSGTNFKVMAVAEDANNVPVFNYTGTIHFTLGTNDPGAKLPDDYTFTATDHGMHLFKVNVAAAGSQTVTATDTTTSSITGSVTVKVNPVAGTTHFLVFALPHVAGGSATQVMVVAMGDHRPIPNYTGTVHLTSSDTNATLPDDYTFTATDHGHHLFQVTLQTAGPQTITATDTTTSSITGQASLTVNALSAVTHFGVYSAPWALAGLPTMVMVVALDAANDIVMGYSGTVHITSTDGSATLPADYTFSSSENGHHLFSATFATAGTQTLTITDASNNALAGSVDITVFSKPNF